MKKVLNLAFAFALATIFVACNDENTPTVGNLTIDLTGLEELGADFVYEGWLIVDGNPVSTGTFTSVVFPQIFTLQNSDLQSATKFVLSIEPTVDSDPEPSATKILAGDFSGNAANVSSETIVGNFSNSTGKYILATPTDMDSSNETSGVWFLDNSSGSAVKGLDLPVLSDGWKYEGWVVLNGTPVSTGTFSNTDAADDNALTAPYKGISGNGPGFPGEDYVMGSVAGIDFPTDLRGVTIVISVEPSPDNNTAPFTLKPLAQEIPSNAIDHTTLTMSVGPKTVLSGSVSR
ncbi:anti-sigma factor [Polaribacter sp. MSW13]|uniref:Anti-sigma factor n=1 Tax=Polaribacter marinus TaxID=2916838 RepID=A0A9X2AIH0_9FLAO|nr:anti-sigma factor [Polaribacter marinus]MCI2228087.1 anti-sigma factor [Polaribacter marinus]